MCSIWKSIEGGGRGKVLRTLGMCGVSLLWASSLAGQEVPDGGAGAGNSAGAQRRISVAPAEGTFESNTLLEMMDRAFDTQSDSFDPESGEMRWKGKTFQMGNSRIFKARFERYLNIPNGNLEEHREYQMLLDDIFDKLSTRSQEAPAESVSEAWLMLFEAADFEADANNSVVIANLVYNAWRIRDEHRANQLARRGLESDRVQAESMVNSRARMLLEMAESRAREGKALRPGAASSGSDLANRQRDLATIEARIQALEGRNTMTAQQAKLQFQSQILSFFFQRRFQHALISTSFYRLIFKATAQDLEVGQKELKDFMPDTDLVPSIETLEFLAREAIADVVGGMAAVEIALAEGRLVSSMQRLQETFFLGEHTLPVLKFPYEKRQELLGVYRKMEEASKLADLKDFDEVERVAAELAEVARDFRSSEVFSAVRSMKQMSNLALFSAQQSVAAGDLVRAEEGLGRSARLWPLNPALESFTRQISMKVDVSNQAARMFDEQYARRQFRQIFDRRSELLPGVFGDEERSDKMREVMDNVGRIDMLLAQSGEMVAQENPFGAWEMLAAAAKIDPNDVLLNQERARLAPRVASFAGVLDSAGRHEAEENFAVSLAQYLKVREIYPASRLAREGIARVGEKLMDRISEEKADANGEAEVRL